MFAKALYVTHTDVMDVRNHEFVAGVTSGIGQAGVLKRWPSGEDPRAKVDARVAFAARAAVVGDPLLVDEALLVALDPGRGDARQ
ncbi:MAG: hypothetical protein ABW194_07435 [Novosphingobium sp.]